MCTQKSASSWYATQDPVHLVSIEKAFAFFLDQATTLLFNVGGICGNGSAFNDEDMCPMFAHLIEQQWLASLCSIYLTVSELLLISGKVLPDLASFKKFGWFLNKF